MFLLERSSWLSNILKEQFNNSTSHMEQNIPVIVSRISSRLRESETRHTSTCRLCRCQSWPQYCCPPVPMVLSFSRLYFVAYCWWVIWLRAINSLSNLAHSLWCAGNVNLYSPSKRGPGLNYSGSTPCATLYSDWGGTLPGGGRRIKWRQENTQQKKGGEGKHYMCQGAEIGFWKDQC